MCSGAGEQVGGNGDVESGQGPPGLQEGTGVLELVVFLLWKYWKCGPQTRSPLGGIRNDDSQDPPQAL